MDFPNFSGWIFPFHCHSRHLRQPVFSEDLPSQCSSMGALICPSCLAISLIRSVPVSSVPSTARPWYFPPQPVGTCQSAKLSTSCRLTHSGKRCVSWNKVKTVSSSFSFSLVSLMMTTTYLHTVWSAPFQVWGCELYIGCLFCSEGLLCLLF